MLTTPEMINEARRKGACPESLGWLEAAPRTTEELEAYDPAWAEWAYRHDIPGLPMPRVTADGQVEYWQAGRRHRTDGPAVVWPDRYTEYWQDGKQIMIRREQ